MSDHKPKSKVSAAAWTPLLLATTMLTGVATPALAQNNPNNANASSTASSNDDEIIVTATKRSENIQNVPMSIQAIGTERLEQLNVQSFNDYAQFLPSLTYQSAGPGFARTFMRGVNSGDNGNHSGPLPSVGVYLDEQPITTITGALDLHVYDIARVESLAGPQGTLYGASSLAGTVRIITNRPDPSGFSAAASLEANTVDHGDAGYVAEGYVNVPLASNAAIRLVGWSEHDGGFIDNVHGTRTYPTCAAGFVGSTFVGNDGTCTVDNAQLARNNYNTTDTYGARAALRIDINENWTVTPQVMGQVQRTRGVFAFDPNVGDLEVMHFLPENNHDNWYQASMTVNGHIGDFDLTYAGAYMRRGDTGHSDYTDYSYFYDVLAGYYIYNDNGTTLHNPSQGILSHDRYSKESHELRITSPSENRLRFIAGLFYERQIHNIEQRYVIAGMNDAWEVHGWPDTIWLTEQQRIDRDWAAYGQASFDITSQLTATAGIRFFKSHNTLFGFFGYGSGLSSGTGEAACFGGAINTSPPFPDFTNYHFHGAPCVNLDRGIEETGSTWSTNLTYHLNPDVMVYGTVSTGFRPGGVNRRIFQQALFNSDTLTNYELGFKSSWDQNRVRLNAAIFQEDWHDFQFSFLGANGLTEVRNAGDARIRGIESDFTWRPIDGFTISGAASYLWQLELMQNYCSLLPDGSQTTTCPTVDSQLLAPAGSRLPVTPHLKADLTARQEFRLWNYDSYWQVAMVHQSSAPQDIRIIEGGIIGRLPAYTSFDLSAGMQFPMFDLDFFIRNATDERGELYRYTECQIQVCGAQYYAVPIQPRTIAVRVSHQF
ncbi:MAG: TonB-dependent receptor [Proteobacteria bacterium]|nr:TonB-dependent receptor [Pseudomonadota bacterium]